MKYANKGTHYPRKNKYAAQKTVAYGEVFDSKKEAQRYEELKLLERAGHIFDLCRQVKFELIPTQRDIKTGKVIERSVEYIADFMYKKNLPDGRVETVVEDVKGYKEGGAYALFVCKRKMMLYLKGIRILET